LASIAETWIFLCWIAISTRYEHAATLLPDGTVLITGGTWSNTAFYETAVYDPAGP
jgi:hypothetical protein